MTASILKDYPDRSFPSVLVYSTLLAVLSIAAVGIFSFNNAGLFVSRRRGRSGFCQGRPLRLSFGKDTAGEAAPREGPRANGRV